MPPGEVRDVHVGQQRRMLGDLLLHVQADAQCVEDDRRLYAAQSTVSAGLRSLETQLGVHLLRRTTQTVQLTAAGAHLLTDARRILDAVERLHVDATETASGQRGRLTLGTFTGQDLVHDLPSALRAFRTTHPHIDLRLLSSQRGSTGYAEDLIRGSLDVAFFALSPPPELDVVELRGDGLTRTARTRTLSIRRRDTQTASGWNTRSPSADCGDK
jgi:DNA-binding transcriptional LysR family regulator